MVGLSVCTHPMVMGQLQDVITFIENSVCAGTASCSTPGIVAFSFASRLDTMCDNMFDILDRSLSHAKIGNDIECIETIFSAW